MIFNLLLAVILQGQVVYEERIIGIKVDKDEIVRIEPNSPAALAGLVKGDRIIKQYEHYYLIERKICKSTGQPAATCDGWGCGHTHRNDITIEMVYDIEGKPMDEVLPYSYLTKDWQ